MYSSPGTDLWAGAGRRFASEGKGDVFVTDNVLTLLMCTPRTVYSWDLVITRTDGKIYIDRRDAAGAPLQGLVRKTKGSGQRP